MSRGLRSLRSVACHLRSSTRAMCTGPAPIPNDANGYPSCEIAIGVPWERPTFEIVEPVLRPLRSSLVDLVATDLPILTETAEYFFLQQQTGKGFRPAIVLLAASAAASGAPADASQQRLAQIVEMIHVSSLMHDDVIDRADTRRGAPAVHKVFGAKTAVQGGDFLLARATVLLARLGNDQVKHRRRQHTHTPQKATRPPLPRPISSCRWFSSWRR